MRSAIALSYSLHNLQTRKPPCRGEPLRFHLSSRATESIVKKKIRVIQYGVGPIGAAIVRLMREKKSIEIIGAIDSDPAKAGQDLGDLLGAPGAPWGVPITNDAAAMLGESADVVIHSTSTHLPEVMDQLMACLAAEACVVSTCEELARSEERRVG